MATIYFTIEPGILYYYFLYFCLIFLFLWQLFNSAVARGFFACGEAAITKNAGTAATQDYMVPGVSESLKCYRKSSSDFCTILLAAVRDAS